MAEIPEAPIPEEDEGQDSRRAGWLPWAVLVIVVLIVLWLLRGCAPGADVEPGTTIRKTVIIKTPGIEKPPAAYEASATADDAEELRVPDVIGLSESEAADALEREGFQIGVTRLYSTSEPVGLVFEQTPGPFESAEQGAKVEVLVSMGPESTQTVKVPDMIGLRVDDAEALAESRGLVPRLMFQPKPESKGRVYQQSPAPGSSLPKGEKVFLLAGEAPGY